jgi:hypothetical protein
LALRFIETDVEIDAPAQAVWEILRDLSHWPEWHPFVSVVVGDLTVGSRVRLVKGSGERSISVYQKVAVVEPGTEFRLAGKLGWRGLLDNEHRFRVESTGDDKCRFFHGQAFRGLLVRMLIRRKDGSSYEVFEEINQALKKRAEAGPEAER